MTPHVPGTHWCLWFNYILIYYTTKKKSLHQHSFMFLEPTIPRSQPQKLLFLFSSCCNIWPVYMWTFTMEVHFSQSLQVKSLSVLKWVYQTNRQNQTPKKNPQTKPLIFLFLITSKRTLTSYRTQNQTCWLHGKIWILNFGPSILQGRSHPLIWLSEPKAFKARVEQSSRFHLQSPKRASIFLSSPCYKQVLCSFQ